MQGVDIPSRGSGAASSGAWGRKALVRSTGALQSSWSSGGWLDSEVRLINAAHSSQSVHSPDLFPPLCSVWLEMFWRLCTEGQTIYQPEECSQPPLVSYRGCSWHSLLQVLSHLQILTESWSSVSWIWWCSPLSSFSGQIIRWRKKLPLIRKIK